MQSASRTPLAARRARAGLIPIVGLALAGWAGGAGATDLFVICHPAVGLQATDVRDAFIGDKGFVGTVKLAPADNSAAQAAFLDKVLKVDAGKYAAIWTKKSFRDGINSPPLKSSDAEAVAYVRQTQGGCSYVVTPPGPGVAIVARF